MTQPHKTIWLQPWCAECDKNSGDGRQWCEDDIWEQCSECDERSVKYVIAVDGELPAGEKK